MPENDDMAFVASTELALRDPSAIRRHKNLVDLGERMLARMNMITPDFDEPNIVTAVLREI